MIAFMNWTEKKMKHSFSDPAGTLRETVFLLTVASAVTRSLWGHLRFNLTQTLVSGEWLLVFCSLQNVK